MARIVNRQYDAVFIGEAVINRLQWPATSGNAAIMPRLSIIDVSIAMKQRRSHGEPRSGLIAAY